MGCTIFVISKTQPCGGITLNYILYFIGAFLLCTILMPLAIKVGEKYFMDRPNKRKLHKEPKPRSGGIAVLASAFLFVLVSPVKIELLTPLVILFIVGLLDDHINVPAKYKLITQLVVAFMAFYSGIQIHSLTLFGATLSLGVLALPFTIIWLTVCMNAFNLIDGLDGLATSLVLISSIFLAILALLYTHYYLFMILAIVSGSCIAFLRYNLHPSKCFLGDAGSLSLGYIMGISTSLLITSKHNIDFIGILLVIFIPVLDTSWAIIRRLRNKTSIFKPDRGHIHHVLYDAFKCDKLTLYTIVAWSFIVGSFGLITNLNTNRNNVLFFVILTIISTVVIYNIAKIKHVLPVKELAVTSNQEVDTQVNPNLNKTL